MLSLDLTSLVFRSACRSFSFWCNVLKRLILSWSSRRTSVSSPSSSLDNWYRISLEFLTYHAANNLPFVSTLWRPFCGCNFKIGCGQPKFPQKRCCCKHFQTPVKLLGEGPPVQSTLPLSLFGFSITMAFFTNTSERHLTQLSTLPE